MFNYNNNNNIEYEILSEDEKLFRAKRKTTQSYNIIQNHLYSLLRIDIIVVILIKIK